MWPNFTRDTSIHIQVIIDRRCDHSYYYRFRNQDAKSLLPLVT